MSNAWEITDADVLVVLNAHQIHVTKEKLAELTDGLDHEAIEDTLLQFTNMDDQTSSMQEDIETYLIQQGVIPKDKERIFSPWEPTDEVETTD